MPQSQLAPSLQSPSRQPRRRGFSNLRRHHPSWIQAMRTGCPVPTSRQPGRVAGDSGKPHSMKDYREGTVPFPDCTILAKLAGKHVPLVSLNGAYLRGMPPRFKSWSRIMPQRVAGVRPLHQRQASGRSAAENVFSMPRGSCKRSRLRLYALRTLEWEGP